MEEISLDEISENVPTQSIMEIENNTIKDSQVEEHLHDNIVGDINDYSMMKTDNFSDIGNNDSQSINIDNGNTIDKEVNTVVNLDNSNDNNDLANNNDVASGNDVTSSNDVASGNDVTSSNNDIANDNYQEEDETDNSTIFINKKNSSTVIGGSKTKTTKKISGYQIGEKVKINMINTSDKYHLETGFVICYTNDELIILKGDDLLEFLEENKIVFTLSDGNIDKSELVNSVDVVEESYVDNFIELIGITINRQVLIHYVDNPVNINHMRKGTVTDITSDLSIKIEFNDNKQGAEQSVMINLKNGLTSSHQIEKIEVLSDEGLSDNIDIDDIDDIDNFLEGLTDLGEVTQEFEIPEHEKTFPEEEEFESVFQSLSVSMMTSHNKKNHIKIEKDIEHCCFQLLHLKRFLNKRHENTGEYLKSANYRRLIQSILSGKQSEFFIPIVDIIRKKYIEDDEPELDDENIDFMKELAESHKHTEDFESKNTGFIDYQQRQDLLFNSQHTSSSKKGFSIKPSDTLECIFDINYPDRLVRCVSDTHFKTIENNYITYTHGDTLNVVGFMSIPNFVNCWNGVYPHMTIREKMDCKMVPINYAIKECRELDKIDNSKLHINQKITFVVNNIVKKGVIIDSHVKGIVVQMDEADIEDIGDNDMGSDSDANTYIVNQKEFLPYQKDDQVYACITIDDESNKQIQTIQGTVINITPKNVYILEDTLGDTLVLPWNTEIWRDSNMCGTDIEKRFHNYTFPDEKIDKDQFTLLLERIIPTASEAFSRGWLDQDKVESIEDAERLLARYYIFLDEIPHYQSEEILSIINDNITEKINDSQSDWDTYHNKLIESFLAEKSTKKSRPKNQLPKTIGLDKSIDWGKSPDSVVDSFQEYYGEWKDFNTRLDKSLTRYEWLSSFPDQASLIILESSLHRHLLEWTPEKVEKEKSLLREKIDILQGEHRTNQEKLDAEEKTVQWFSPSKKKIVKIYHSEDILTSDKGDIRVDPDRDSIPTYSSEEISEMGGLDNLLRRDYPTISSQELRALKQNIIKGGSPVENDDYCVLLLDGNLYGSAKLYKRISPGGGKSMWTLERSIEGEELQSLLQQDKINSKTPRMVNNRLEKLQSLVASNMNTIQGLHDRMAYLNSIESVPKNLAKQIKYWKEYYLSKPVRQSEILKRKSNEIKIISKKLGLSEKIQKSPLELKISNILGKENETERDFLLSKLLQSPLVRDYLPDTDELPYMYYDSNTNKPVLSKHWKLKVELTLNPKKRSKNLEILKKNYGVREEGSEWIICKYDGDRIAKIDLDTKEGFEDEGVHKQSRDIMEEELTEKNLQKILGLQTRLQLQILHITFELSKSLYVDFNKQNFESVIEDVYQKIGTINSDEWCRATISEQIKKNKINNKKFKTDTSYSTRIKAKILEEFSKYKEQTLLTTVSSRILIVLQTSIPDLEIKGVHPSCVFSIKGYPLTTDETKIGKSNEGIHFMSCILQQLAKSGEPWNVLLHEKIENIQKKITKRITEFYQNNNIKNYYSEKRNYLETLKARDSYLSTFGLSGLPQFLPSPKIKRLRDTKIDRKPKITVDYYNQITHRQFYLATEKLNDILQRYNPYPVLLVDAQKRPLIENVCNYYQIDKNLGLSSLNIPTDDSDIVELENTLAKLPHQTWNHLNINSIVYNIRSENVYFESLTKEEIAGVFINYCYQAPFTGIKRLANNEGKCLISRIKSDALKNGLSLGDKINYWIQSSQEHSNKSYKEYVQFVKENTTTTIQSSRRSIFENSDTVDLLKTIFKSDDIDSIDFNNPTSEMITNLSNMLDDEISNTNFDLLKIPQQSSYFWNNLINQLVIGLVRNNNQSLSKYNSNIWKFTDDNYKNYGKEIQQRNELFAIETPQLLTSDVMTIVKRTKECQTRIKKIYSEITPLLLQLLCLRFVRLVTSQIDANLHDDDNLEFSNFDQDDIDIKQVDINEEPVVDSEKGKIQLLFEKILQENIVLNDDLIKQNIEIFKEKEKQRFIQTKDELSDDHREIDNQLQKFGLGKWSKGVYDYWNDNGDEDGDGVVQDEIDLTVDEDHGVVKDDIDRSNTQVDINIDKYGDEIDREEET